ncbi:hypothetical protein SCA03_64120 [Streptomyces cacaoi]|uniref:Uncharacterized protein n=1 Tax=Streptomyces cacaoi TaxID=1898 RepID=A0A4Y3R8A4_STRCI|nr:hypothetical protein SCA03_64120 [Streptomyces cacaoi]
MYLPAARQAVAAPSTEVAAVAAVRRRILPSLRPPPRSGHRERPDGACGAVGRRLPERREAIPEQGAAARGPPGRHGERRAAERDERRQEG